MKTFFEDRGIISQAAVGDDPRGGVVLLHDPNRAFFETK